MPYSTCRQCSRVRSFSKFELYYVVHQPLMPCWRGGQEFVRAVLGVRLSQLSLLRGESTRHKLLLVKGLPPAKIFDLMQAFMARARD